MLVLKLLGRLYWGLPKNAPSPPEKHAPMKLSTFVPMLALVVASQLYGQTLTTVWNNGPSSNRVDLIFIGDGYTGGQIESTYASHVQDELDYLFSGAYRNPFPRYQSFFNAHRVNVVSNESGADQPPNNIFRDTALDASYWTGGVERCLYLDTGKANAAVSTALQGTGIDIDARLGLVNDAKYGGCGGQWAVYAAANSSAADIGVHELGHSLGQLADEYFYNNDTYTGPEPSSVNLTKTPTTGKWDRWVGYVDPDTPIGPINYYEGGGYNRFGLFRPSNNSEMRALFRPFDAVSREQFIKKFYDEVDPLDDWAANSSIIEDPEELWVDRIDPGVIALEWSLNGDLLASSDETLDVAALQLAPGSHLIEARAYDTLLDHSFTGDSLDWWRRTDTSPLEQYITWNIQITTDGDFNGDGQYDCEDVDALVAEIVGGANNDDFDLTGEGVVNQGDLAQWLQTAGANNLPSGNAYLRGDANLDGYVDGSDFVEWNENKFSSQAAWCAGDFNADGEVDGMDFVVWNMHKFMSSDSYLSLVPEPGAGGMLLLGLLVCLKLRRLSV